jgi:signal transduction histidine kinase
MRLSAFIVANMEPILQEWQEFAHSLGAITSSMDAAALRDHAEEMLRAVAADLDTPQSAAQQEAKGTGHAPAHPLDHPVSAATSHGSIRAADGFTLEQMVAEYRALRASVLRLWAKHEIIAGVTTPMSDSYTQQIRFNEAIDEALTDSIHTYSQAVDQMFAAKARRRMEAMGTLAAGLGHDMANVLLPMRACMAELSDEKLSPAITPLLQGLHRAVEHLTGLAKGLRALSMDPDDVAISSDLTDLQDWWMTAISPFTWALPRGVCLHVEGLVGASPKLPTVRVPAHVLMQAVYNLVQNAGQALLHRNTENAASHGADPTGNIWITAAHEPALARAPETSPGVVRIIVRDDGPGMNESTVLRCTDAFFTTKSKNLGSGLGLYVVRTALERHGGKLLVHSRLGEGTTFTLLLPTGGEMFSKSCASPTASPFPQGIP